MCLRQVACCINIRGHFFQVPLLGNDFHRARLPAACKFSKRAHFRDEIASINQKVGESPSGQVRTIGTAILSVRTCGYSRRKSNKAVIRALTSGVEGTIAVDGAAFGRRLVAEGVEKVGVCRLLATAFRRSGYFFRLSVLLRRLGVTGLVG